MIDSLAIIDDLIKAIITDKDFIAHFVAEFPGKDLHFEKLRDANLNPGIEEYPLIAFSAIEEIHNQESSNYETLKIPIEIAIAEEGKKATANHPEEPTQFSVKVSSYSGADKVERLRRKVQEAIKKNSTFSISFLGESLLENYYPVFKSSIIGTIEEPKINDGSTF